MTKIKNDVYDNKNPVCRLDFLLLKEFKLLSWGIRLLGLLAIEYLYFSKLAVGNAQYSHFPIFGKEGPNTFCVDLHILFTGTMTDIYGELKHRKPIMLQVFAKIHIGFLVFLCFRWQIEEYKYPHNSIFRQT